jgi:hypothetical protein
MTQEPPIYFRIHGGIDALMLDLSTLRANVCCYHKEAFPVEKPVCSSDPRCWVARTLDQEIANLLHTLRLYRNAQKCFDSGATCNDGDSTSQAATPSDSR